MTLKKATAILSIAMCTYSLYCHVYMLAVRMYGFHLIGLFTTTSCTAKLRKLEHLRRQHFFRYLIHCADHWSG